MEVDDCHFRLLDSPDGISDIEHVAIEGMELLEKVTLKAKPRWVAARKRGRERHRWANRRSIWAGAHESVRAASDFQSR